MIRAAARLLRRGDRRSGAVFDSTEVYRYRLWRRWRPAAPRLAFILLNPSTADETRDDPTIRRCIGYAHRWGFGAVEILNLFALRSTDPAALRGSAAPIGPGNDRVIRTVARQVDRVVVAWGNHGVLLNRAATVLAALSRYGVRPLCLAVTAQGQPRHPLYSGADLSPRSYPIFR